MAWANGSLLHDQGHPLIESGAVGLFVVVQAIFLIPGAQSTAESQSSAAVHTNHKKLPSYTSQVPGTLDTILAIEPKQTPTPSDRKHHAPPPSYLAHAPGR